MKIIISNTVTLNGGDFAILDSIINVLKQTYGNDIEIIVYDNDAEVASVYYPEITYRKLIYFKYWKKALNKYQARLLYFYNTLTLKRFMLAAKFFKEGRAKMANLLLTQKQKEDFDIYASADMIISTGGTYLVENYNMKARFFDYHFTLALNKPLVFFTQSLGPYKKPKNKQILKNIFNQASLILLRDEASLNHLKEINVNVTKARVCADVVFADADPAILQIAQTRDLNKPLRVGISVRNWTFFKDRSAQEGMRQYSQSVAAICEYITGTLGGEILFLSTCQGIKDYWKDDAADAKKIYDLLSPQAKNKCAVNSDFNNPDQLKALVKDFDVVISTRMHFAIQSLAMGVPVLPIAYEFKTKELFSKLISPEFILDIDTIKADHAVEVFKSFLTVLPATRADLFKKVEEERQSALKPVQYLKEALPALKA